MKALATLALSLILAGCMGNTVNYITVANGGEVVLENAEEGNTATATPTTTLTGVP